MGVEVWWEPLADSSTYTKDQQILYADDSNQIYWSHVDSKIHIVRSGVTEVLPTALTWTAFDAVALWVETGGSSLGSRGARRSSTDGVTWTATTQLGTLIAAPGNFVVFGSMDIANKTSDTNLSLVNDLYRVEFYAAGTRPAWA